jgi:N-acetylglucosamine-6-phosphate deacetylase
MATERPGTRQLQVRDFESGEFYNVSFPDGKFSAQQVEPSRTQSGLDDRAGSDDPTKSRSNLADPTQRDLWIAPGLVDLQVNGYCGVSFSDPQLSDEQVLELVSSLRRQGVTRFLATLTTNSPEAVEHSLTLIAQITARQPDIAQSLIGIHLEGPFISPIDGPRGAHPKAHCRAPDWKMFERWQNAARGMIRLVTLSPEYPDSASFIRSARVTGVMVSIGHTNANSEQIRAAADAGATMSTHLGNGAHAMIRRHPNYIWDQLSDDRLTASLITDGFHLPPSVVKAMVRAKSLERVVLVSDLTGLAGMPAGTYGDPALGEVDVLEDGRLVVAGQRDYLAGASKPLWECVCNAAQFAEIELHQAIRMASSRPLELLKTTQSKGKPKDSGSSSQRDASDRFPAEGDYMIYRDAPHPQDHGAERDASAANASRAANACLDRNRREIMVVVCGGNLVHWSSELSR